MAAKAVTQISQLLGYTPKSTTHVAGADGSTGAGGSGGGAASGAGAAGAGAGAGPEQKSSSQGSIKKLDLKALVASAGGKVWSKVLFFPNHKEAHVDNSGDMVTSFEIFLSLINSATKTLDVCVYTISDDRISNVIAQLYATGVQVRVITDRYYHGRHALLSILAFS
jgi:hypothetical protein